MKKIGKTKKQLIEEVAQMRQRIAELEASGRKRNQFEEALRAERNKAQHYLDIAEVILVALNKKGEITLINRKGNQILGYKEGELLGKNWFTTCLPSPFRKDVRGVFLKLMAGEGRITEFYENPVLTKSGTKRMIAWHNTLLKDAQGNNIGTLSSGEDITERKQAEESLRESEATLRALINAPTDSVLLLDTRGAILDLNKIAAQRLGKSRDELIGTLADDSLPKDIAKRRRSSISQILETGRAVRFEDQRDGIWYDTVAHPVTDKDGAVGRVAIIARDITDRKRLEEILEKERRELKLIVDSSPIIVFYKDNEGRFIRVNKTFAEALKIPAGDFVGKTVFDLYSPEIAQGMTDDDQEVLQSQRPKLNIIEQYESAGGIRWVRTDKIPICDRDGMSIGLIGFAQDITERKQAEEEIISLARFPSENPNPVLRLGHDGTILYANKASRLLLQDWGASVGSPAPPFWQEIVTQALGSQSKNIVEVACKEQVYSFVVAPIPDAGYVNLYGRDITERKQVEEALQESEEKYRDLVENISDILYAIDEHGIVTYVAPAIESLSGYAPSEIIGHPFSEFVYREDGPYIMEKFQEDLAGHPEPHEFRMVNKAGVVRWVRTSSRPFFKETRAVGLRGVMTDLTARKQAEEEVKRGYEQLQETLHSTVSALASTVEMKDQYTAGHQPRVRHLACAIAGEMGLSEEQIEGIRMAASIHDIGKIMVPAEILNKPGPLTEIQYEMIKMHPRAGYDILKGIKFPWPVAQIILQHHELMDGSGYPQGLSGEKIMVEARILTVANVVEAMNAHRPYRPAFDIKVALAEISKNRGILYDPAVVDACLRLFTEKGFKLD
ncbi:MAG: hypothetical protein A2Z08_08280 [Deltaproteobacteria bacterium RBG_16_54_11]|nr:MAG: hypothetical protein A2Z08_08280 [Deltaproteobacteria bacterium RBG_16_54_11]